MKTIEIVFGILILLGAARAGVAFVRGWLDPPLERWKMAWVAAFLAAIGVTLLVWGDITAAFVAIAFVGFTVLAVTAVLLFLLLGAVPVLLRILMILHFCVGLVGEVVSLVCVFESIPGGGAAVRLAAFDLACIRKGPEYPGREPSRREAHDEGSRPIRTSIQIFRNRLLVHRTTLPRRCRTSASETTRHHALVVRGCSRRATGCSTVHELADPVSSRR